MTHHTTTSAPGDLASAVGTLATSVSGAVDEFLRSMAQPAPRHRGAEHAHHGCSCGRERCGCHGHDGRADSCRCGGCADHHACSCRSCHCACCIGDADLVVYARYGERRVVPIRLSNPRRRDRDVSLELSEFTTPGGRSVPVQGVVVDPTSFTLEACRDHDVTLMLSVGGLEKYDEEAEERGEERRMIDVDDCVVAVADLRIVGCHVRPVRIAVAVLPRDCSAYTVSCECGCCG